MKKGQEPSTGKIETTSEAYVLPEFLPWGAPPTGVVLKPPKLRRVSPQEETPYRFFRQHLAGNLHRTSAKTRIQLEFLGPKPGDAVNRATAVSGEKLLRNIMQDNKIELYAAYGKVMNCGGGGSCGTCIVEILDGKDLLNERTNTELRYLKKACSTYYIDSIISLGMSIKIRNRSPGLACQTIVGNKENSGKVRPSQVQARIFPLTLMFLEWEESRTTCWTSKRNVGGCAKVAPMEKMIKIGISSSKGRELITSKG
ncbi:Photosynthetic NDH subunit of subcomplex B 3, chloroplastic [Sesamum angolense]|uniref:Photosynthetic NDH subunit of subcomplex B 3, chloroplastic n=1 Tax=Sesamum angolense TaxID=2727404 RepID=A0AAE1WWS0_9LAMI|nr:Photosynthetic NDH subunit of subcomplex B 3, chloroplastic [Sesamum angolense]